MKESDKNIIETYIPTMQELVPEAVYHEYSIDDEVAYLERCSQIAYYRSVESKRILGSVLVLMRKTIRKVMTFLIVPITHDQSVYNAHVATTMRKMEIELEEQREIIEDLKDVIDSLQRD